MIAATSRRTLRRMIKRTAEAVLPFSVLVSRVPAAGPRVALTFDDGPEPLSGALLDRLDELGVSATFFLIGKLCGESRATVVDMVRRGHEVAGHGYTHRRFPKLSASELRDELRQTRELLPPSPARAYVRPPHGTLDPLALARCAGMGFTTVMWSLDSLDAHTRDAQAIIEQAGAARPGDILLLHEGQQWTIDALPAIVERLRARGIECCTVSDLLQAAVH